MDDTALPRQQGNCCNKGVYPSGLRGLPTLEITVNIMLQNPNDKGKATESQVLAYMIGLGYSISIPFGDKDKYDQIWDINGKLIKVQVKTARLNEKEKNPSNVSIKFNCKSTVNGTNRKYTKEDIDYFATYWQNQVYLVPVEECSIEKVLRFTSSQPNQPAISWAKDYKVEEVLKRL